MQAIQLLIWLKYTLCIYSSLATKQQIGYDYFQSGCTSLIFEAEKLFVEVIVTSCALKNNDPFHCTECFIL